MMLTAFKFRRVAVDMHLQKANVGGDWKGVERNYMAAVQGK